MATTKRKSPRTQKRTGLSEVEHRAEKAVSKAGKDAQKAMNKATKQTRERAAKLAKNVVEFEKTTFDGTAKLAGGLQERSEKLLLQVINQSEWLPKEVKKGVDEWVKMVRRARADFTKTMDRSFKLMNDLIERMEAAEAPKKARAHHASSTSGKPKRKTRKRAPAKAKRRAPSRKAA